MDITFVSIKYIKRLMELRKISADGIPEYIITHTPDKEVSKSHFELLSCASTFEIISYVASTNCFR